jgi:peptidyl-dipeptidase Dcp
MTDNPLLKPFEEAPFSQIKNDHFKPAIDASIKEARREIDIITENPERPTFENTLEALDYSGQQLGRVAGIFFNLNSAETNENIQKIAQEVSPWLSELSNDLLLNKELFERVKAVHEQKDELDLSKEQKTLLDKQYKNFTRNGANLPAEKQERLREIDQELSQLSLKFGEHTLAETNAYELHLTDEKDVSGLPDSAKKAAAALAKENGEKGYIFTLHFPSFLPFMKFADNRELRKKLAVASGAKGFQDNQNNNEKIVLKIVNLRFERAQLLGFNNHADFVLQERMAKNPEKVQSFLNDILEKSKPAAKKEFEELQAFAKEKDGIADLQKWDKAYYSEKLKKEKFDLDDEDLKPYFKLENVIDGAFLVAKKLYGLHFKEVHDVEKYNAEIKTFRVYDDDDNFIALFYADFHPRDGKRGGAWMTTYRDQMIEDGENQRPQVSIVCNFTRSSEEEPSLLTFTEVTTLFHEFGHALHAMLADTTYPGLSSPNVLWDFVELPSQVMENWCYEPEALQLFAKHYKTDEPIPEELIEKIKASATFNEGMFTLRQLSFGLLDMAWHAIDPREITDIKKHELKAFEPTKLFPDIPENCMSASFPHIFQGGYSAGYYSYKWAEVLDADAFEYFKENGIFNTEVAQKFKDNILTKGGTEDPMVLYKRFRGKEPDPDALLKRAGLVS